MDKLLLWHLKWKGKTQKDVLVASEWKINVNEALKPFWGIIFPSFNRDENKTIDALSSEFWIQIAAMYSISSKLKSAFSMIGKTTANKLNFKTCRGKGHAFAFVWIINSSTRSWSETRLWNFEHFCAFRSVFLPNPEWKFVVIELPAMFLSFGCLYLGILGLKSEQNICMLDFWIFNSRRPRGLFI